MFNLFLQIPCEILSLKNNLFVLVGKAEFVDKFVHLYLDALLQDETEDFRHRLEVIECVL